VGAGGLMLLLDNKLTAKKKIGSYPVIWCNIRFIVGGNLVMNSINSGLSTGTRYPS